MNNNNINRKSRYLKSDSQNTIPEKKKWLENPNMPAYIEFFEHFEIVEMFNHKIMIARCKKLNG